MTSSIEARVASLTARYASLERAINEIQQLIGDPSRATASHRHRDPLDIKELQPCKRDTPEVAALRSCCLTNGFHSAVFRWVPSDYYSRSLQWRRDILEAPSIHHLCKSIVLENTHCVHPDCSQRENSRYYIIVYPYTQKFDAELLMRRIKAMNEGLGKNKFNFRLANPTVSQELTGFCHGAVAPIGTTTRIPVILSDYITTLSPPVFWMGGGHVDCKLRIDVAEFTEKVNPIIASVTTPLSAEELEQLID